MPERSSYPNFFGTSAATPHAAGIAALMLQANPAATPTQIYASLRSSALPMSTSTPNFSSGYGFIQADTALVIPTLSLSAPSIALGLDGHAHVDLGLRHELHRVG